MAKKHWIYIKRGLSEDAKHRAQMGKCIWLYMHIIDRADWETGIAYDWRDKEEADQMDMPVDTLRYQRQKLEEMDYIRCKQEQHGQNIFIMEWKNPRDYGSETKNPRNQGSNELPPSEIQGSNQGLNQGSNQVPRKVKTPTSTSKIIDHRSTPAPDFANLSIAEAKKVPTLKMYWKATGFWPGDRTWAFIHQTITDHQLTEEQIRLASTEWDLRGYRQENIRGILEWAVGGIPLNGNGGSKPATGAAPAIDEAAVEATRQLIEAKYSSEFSPPPAGLRPNIQIKQLAKQKGIRR
jgi:hypothetical protein